MSDEDEFHTNDEGSEDIGSSADQFSTYGDEDLDYDEDTLLDQNEELFVQDDEKQIEKEIDFILDDNKPRVERKSSFATLIMDNGNVIKNGIRVEFQKHENLQAYKLKIRLMKMYSMDISLFSDENCQQEITNKEDLYLFESVFFTRTSISNLKYENEFFSITAFKAKLYNLIKSCSVEVGVETGNGKNKIFSRTTSIFQEKIDFKTILTNIADHYEFLFTRTTIMSFFDTHHIHGKFINGIIDNKIEESKRETAGNLYRTLPIDVRSYD
tara:strand:+ start:425 stop:1234 length:810 start_codon:yes stop_codon:yes gene_type:complete